MKKSVLFAIIFGLFLTVFYSSFVSATMPLYVGSCTAGELGQNKEVSLQNDCGSVWAECTYTKPWNWDPGGYRWKSISCIQIGNGLCCDTGPGVESCGYLDVGTECESCKRCGNYGTCSVDFTDWNSCQEGEGSGSCIEGTCNLDNADPLIDDEQENIYIRDVSQLEEIYNTLIDVEFSDDLRLSNYKIRVCDEESSSFFVNRSDFFPAPVIVNGCAEEVVALTDKEYREDWKLSNEMWDWIIETVLNQGKVSMNIELNDYNGKQVLGDLLFFIISDFTNPEVSISHTLSDVPGGKEVKITAVGSDMLGEFETNIFIDGEKLQTCTDIANCELSRIYSEGSHNYYSTVTDPSSNSITSETGTFSIETVNPSCEESFGQICNGDSVCDQGTFPASDTNECCAGACITETVEIPTCEDQEGTIFNPKSHTCSGEEVVASEISEYLRCCVGNVQEIPNVDRLEVYWTDDAGERIVSSSLGSTVNCKGSGITGDAEFTVTKSEVLESKSLTLPNSISISVGEMGIYECEVNVAGTTKKTTLSVVELPAQLQQTALPVFGFINILAVLSLIIVYYLFRRK